MTFKEQNIAFAIVLVVAAFAFGAAWVVLAMLKVLASGVLVLDIQ